MHALRNITMPSSHRRNDSGELDVFEAALYFSGEVICLGLIGLQRAAPQGEPKGSLYTATPMEATVALPHQQPLGVERRKQLKHEKKNPSSSSSSNKLGIFLSSLFHQKVSRKKSKTEEEHFVEGQTKSETESFRSTSGESKSSSSDTRTGHFYFDREVLKNEGVNGTGTGKLCNKEMIKWAKVFTENEGKWWRRRKVVEEDGRSDSSSDLFELNSLGLRA